MQYKKLKSKLTKEYYAHAHAQIYIIKYKPSLNKLNK